MKATVNVLDENGNIKPGQVIDNGEIKIHPEGVQFHFGHDAETGALLWLDDCYRGYWVWRPASPELEHFYNAGEDIFPRNWEITFLDKRDFPCHWVYTICSTEEVEKEAKEKLIELQKKDKRIVAFDIRINEATPQKIGEGHGELELGR
jgi:hypothetical protein